MKQPAPPGFEDPLPYVAKAPNVMPDVARFLALWEEEQPADPGSLLVSRWGNINLTGGTHISPALDLTPFDPRWPSGIERGVAPLVDFLTTRLSWVTYDSCAGHYYPPEVSSQPAVRRVGILPRSPGELGTIAWRVSQLSRELEKSLEVLSVSFVVYRAHLYSVADPMRYWDAVEMEYRPRLGESWSAYFRDLDIATSLTLVSFENLLAKINEDE